MLGKPSPDFFETQISDRQPDCLQNQLPIAKHIPKMDGRLRC